jgi:hypothetical protein
MQFEFELSRPQIEGGARRRFAMPFGPIVIAFKTSKRRNGMAKIIRGPPSRFQVEVNSNTICFTTQNVMLDFMRMA